MTYEERLYKAAFALSEERNQRKWRESSAPEDFIYEAIIIVSMQAEAVKEALFATGFTTANSIFIFNYLKQNGYIPEKEEK